MERKAARRRYSKSPRALNDAVPEKGAVAVQRASHLEILGGGEGQICGSDGHAGGLVVPEDEGVLVPERADEVLKGADLGGGVQPKEIAAARDSRNDVVELGRRGQVRIQFVLGADQRGISFEASSAQKRGQQSVLVLAIAILIGEDFGGGVGLVASNAEGDADVAEAHADKVVDGAKFGIIVGSALGQFIGLGNNFRSGLDAVGL